MRRRPKRKVIVFNGNVQHLWPPLKQLSHDKRKGETWYNADIMLNLGFRTLWVIHMRPANDPMLYRSCKGSMYCLTNSHSTISPTHLSGFTYVPTSTFPPQNRDTEKSRPKHLLLYRDWSKHLPSIQISKAEGKWFRSQARRDILYLLQDKQTGIKCSAT